VARTRVERVEVCPERREWRIRLEKLCLSDEERRKVQEAIAGFAPDVAPRVELCGPPAADEEAAAAEEAVCAAAVTAFGDGAPDDLEEAPDAFEDDEAYMRRIMEMRDEQPRPAPANGKGQGNADPGAHVLMGSEIR